MEPSNSIFSFGFEAIASIQIVIGMSDPSLQFISNIKKMPHVIFQSPINDGFIKIICKMLWQ